MTLWQILSLIWEVYLYIGSVPLLKKLYLFHTRRNTMVKMLVNKFRFITSTWFITIIVNVSIFTRWCLTAWLSFCIRTEILNHKTSLIRSHNIKVTVPSQESGLSCIYVLGVSMLPLLAILIFKFGIVPTVWYFSFFPLFYLFIYLYNFFIVLFCLLTMIILV